MFTSTTDISQHSMNKLPLSHRAKRSQIHATALPRHVRRHARRTGQITRQSTRSAHGSADTAEPTHATQALLELRSEHPFARSGTHERSRNHVQEAALACACDRWHIISEWSARWSSSRQARACAESCWAVGCNRSCKRPGMRACDRGFVAACRCWLGARGEGLPSEAHTSQHFSSTTW